MESETILHELENGKVPGFYLLAGDYFYLEGATSPLSSAEQRQICWQLPGVLTKAEGPG